MHAPTPFLRLEAVPAPDVWQARTILTDYAAGARSTATVMLRAGGLRAGDVAGLAVFGRPHAWLGVKRGTVGRTLVQFDERTGTTTDIPLRASRVWLRVECDFTLNAAAFSYSTNGTRFTRIGLPCDLHGGTTGCPSVPRSLFCYSTKTRGTAGHAEFGAYVVTIEPA
jgi:xylan 1,4-beta-xylosidase